MKVVNVVGTSDAKCSCGSWLKHWQIFSGQSIPSYCPEKNCLNTELVGAHVYLAGNYGKKYIYPLCTEHNRSSDPTPI